MPLKDEQVPELHGKMPNVTSENVEKTIVFGGFIGFLLLLLAVLLPHLWTAPATNAPADSKTPCH